MSSFRSLDWLAGILHGCTASNWIEWCQVRGELLRSRRRAPRQRRTQRCDGSPPPLQLVSPFNTCHLAHSTPTTISTYLHPAQAAPVPSDVLRPSPSLSLRAPLTHLPALPVHRPTSPSLLRHIDTLHLHHLHRIPTPGAPGSLSSRCYRLPRTGRRALSRRV
jgi:hypothetical protein